MSTGKLVESRPRGSSAEGFAHYLAHLHVFGHRFHPASGPALAAFDGAGDVVVLSSCTAASVTVVCILDAEDDPERVVALDADRFAEIARVCGHDAETAGAAQRPVELRVIEVRDGIRDEDRHRLDDLCGSVPPVSLGSMPPSYRKIPGMKAVKTVAIVCSPRTREVWSTPGLGPLEERWYRRAVVKPRKTSLELAAMSARASRPPWLTLGIVALSAALFFAERALAAATSAHGIAPPASALVAMGGASGALVLARGEVWRVVTSALLHADLMRLICDGASLLLAGWVLERRLGRAWLAAIFVGGAAFGSLASIAVHGPDVVSVGASGAIMALFAAALVVSHRVAAPMRRALQRRLLPMLLPSLIPIGVSLAGGRVDLAAHAGGAAAGVALGLVLLWTWPRADRLPRFRRAAAAVALGAAALGVFGLLHVAAIASHWSQGVAGRFP